MPEKKYFVTRQMIGDRPYFAGDIRTMDEHDAKHLVDRGALEEFDPKKHGKKAKKAEDPPAKTGDDKTEDPNANDGGKGDGDKADGGEGDSDKAEGNAEENKADGGEPAAKKGAAKKAAAAKE